MAGTAYLYPLSREAALAFNMIFLGMLTSLIARKKNRNFLGWLVVGTLTGIIGLAVVIAAKPKVASNEHISGI